MSAATGHALRAQPLRATQGVRREVVPSSVLGVVVLVAAELIFFAGLVSAFLIGKAAAGVLAWPPAGQPRLPVAETAVNTVVLLASGVVLAIAQRVFRTATAGRTRRLVTLALVLGALFVLLQGYEWVRLIGFGLTLTSSTFASFFYLLVGVHAIHAIGALAGLAWARWRLGRLGLSRETLAAVGIFWYFVVGVWPVLYVLVYLS